MTKYNTAHQYWTEVTDRLMSSKEEYAKFLKFSSGIYKHDFTDAAMIYRQNPNATKVAELETWNRLGRRVNRGEHSIVTFGQGIKCKYLFDVTQTHGKKEPDLWTLDDKLSDRLLSEINKKNGLECKNLNEAISKLCFLTMKQINSDGDYPDSYDGFSLDEKKKFNRSILSSARYIISNRCMLNGDITLDTSLNLEGLDLCKTRNDFAEFGNLAHSTAKSALLYMERELLQIMKQIKKEERHLSEDISEKNKVREIPFSVGSTFEIEGTYYKVDEIDIAKDNVRLSAVGSDTAYTRSMDIDELSMFYTQKQIEEKAVDSAIDDILNNNNEIIIENTPVEVNPEIAPLTDENLIAEIIKYGDTRYERNESIANFFNDNQDLDLRAGYISSLYRDETAQFKINGIDVGFEKTEKGLTVWQGTSENREYQSVLSWECVQAIIGKSIEEEKFIDIKKSTAEEIKDIYTSDSEHDIEAFFNNNAVDMTELSAVTEGRRIRCETQDEAEQLFDYLRDNGYTWYDGDTLTRTDWFYAENNTFYTINDDTKTIDRGDSSVYEAYELKRMDIEDFSDVKNDFVSGSKFREPEETAEKKYDLYFHIEKNGVNVYDSSDNIDEPIAVIDSDRNVTVNTELPKSVIENIREYADGMADIYVLPEIRKARSDEPTVKILYAETPCALYQGLTMPFSQADEIFKAVDDNHVNARNNKISGEKYIGYSKVEFEITGGSDNPDFVYKGRYDVGDGENGLFNHIKNNYEYFRSEDYSKYVNAESYEDYQRELDELEKNILPYLEIHLNYEKNLQNQLSTPTMPEWSAYTQYINDVQIAQIGRKIDDSKPLYSGNVEYCSGIFSNDNENGYNVDFAKNLAKKLNENGITDLAEASEFVKSKAIDFKHLGTSENTGYYYFSDRLSRNSLSVIKEKAERYVIAAPSCIISDEQLSDYNISFVKTDRDIPAEIFKGDSNKAMEEMKRFADGLSENTEVSENISDNLTEIDPETAIYMWQDGFDVYVGDTKLNPYDNSYRNDNETGYDLITHGGEICKANNDDIQHYKELDSLAERIDRLQNRVSSDFSLSDYADVEEDYVFDWNNEQTNYQNIEKSLSTNNVEYISVWLNDLKYPDNSGDDDLSEEAILISESLDEYKSKYITPTVQEISEQAEKNNEWFVQTSEGKDGAAFGYIARKIKPDEPMNGRNMQYCDSYFSDDAAEFNIAFAQEIVDKLNDNGIHDIKQANEFIDNEVLKREKELGLSRDTSLLSESEKETKTADELVVGDIIRYDGIEWKITDIDGDFSINLENTDKTSNERVSSIWGHWKENITKEGFEYIGKDNPDKKVQKWAACIRLAEDMADGIESYVSEENKIKDNSYVIGTNENYRKTADILSDFINSHSQTEISELCPYYERDFDEDFQIELNGTEYFIFDTDKAKNKVELIKSEDVISSVKDIKKYNEKTPPLRVEKYDYINRLVNDNTNTIPKDSKTADELVMGDIIRYQDKTWEVDLILNTDIYLKNTDKNANRNDKDLHLGTNWKERLDFEYIGHNIPVSSYEGHQLNLFGEDYSNEPVPELTYPDDVLDNVLRCGGMETNSSQSIVAQYQLGKSNTENAEYLKNEFENYACGQTVLGQNYAVVCGEDGIRINFGETAYGRDSKHISWEEAAKRVGELLEKGEYAPENVLEKADGFLLHEAASMICDIQREMSDKYADDFFIDKSVFSSTYPENMKRVSDLLSDKETLAAYIQESEKLAEKCKENPAMVRLSHKRVSVETLPDLLKDLQREKKEFTAAPDYYPDVRTFISKDEKESQIMQGGNIEASKGSIYDFFTENHTEKEKTDFIKVHYGTGGSAGGKHETWHDNNGFILSRENPYGEKAQALISWKTFASETDKAIKNGLYFTEKDRQDYVKYANSLIESAINDSHYGINRIDIAKKILEKHDTVNSETALPETDIVPEKEKNNNIFIINAAVHSNYEGMVALVGEDERVYLGKSENYDSKGHYDNSDNSLEFVSDNDKMFSFISSKVDGGWVVSQQEMLDNGAFTLEDYREFTRLQSTVLSKYNQLYDVTFNSVPFQPVSDKTVLDSPETVKKENYHFNESDIVKGGQKSKYRANVEAIKTLLTVEKENRNATPEEQSVMAGYSGWGGIPQAFDRRNSDWADEYDELRELLSESEYKDARASTLTSYYTPPQVTDAIYQALEQFGFKGGNVLEPSMGIGNFFAKMPTDMADNSKLYGVELDSISGRIAKKLYPDANIQVTGFEKTAFNDNSFDVAVGNVPFSDVKVYDRAYDKYKFPIHDYFAAKTIDKVKPNGIVAIVTSKYTMDKQSEKARQYLAERCDLLGAVRLPAGTFGDAKNVTTDILFLQKRETRAVTTPDWVHLSETPDGIPCNKYFADNPDMILGKMEYDKRMQGRYGEDSKATVCSPTEGDLTEKLKAAISKIQGKIAVEHTENISNEDKSVDTIPADPSVRNFTHTMVDGHLYHRRNEVMVKVEATGKNLQRMIGLHNIRQAAMELINAQANNCSDTEFEKLKDTLNDVYNKFREEFGCISDRANARVFREDDDYNTLCAFEVVDKETKEVVKADIFKRRTITAEEEITSVKAPDEALQVSLDRLGRVDIEFMSGLLDKTPEDTITSLTDMDLIYRNPETIKSDNPYSGYEDKSEYLSGNVRKKLDIAKAYATTISPEFERNAEALEKVIPKTIEADEITVRIGVNWIEPKDYSRFISEELGIDMWDDRLTRQRNGEYKIENKRNPKSVNMTATYGTSRMTALQIFENLLNNRGIVVKDAVKDENDKTTYVTNAKETQLAKEKARVIGEKFKNWFWRDLSRREYYVAKYNNLFNSIVGREYDGKHQTFSGMNPAIELRKHQKDAIMRAKLGGNTLLAHCVGAGKSFEMDAAVMEKKRLGLISKACVVVPKHLTLQTAYEWQRLYPSAKLLVATPDDFKPDNRQQFIAKCVTGDYDAVIMSYSQFEKIPMSNAYRAEFMVKQLDSIDEAIDDTDKSDRATIKQLEKERAKLQAELEKLLDSPKDNSLTFEQLGFDYLVVDEAHNYKNCLVVSKMKNVAGVSTTSAKKSADMLMKTQYLNEKYGMGNVLWATGTPVSNSMVELYSMTRYLRPDLLENAGLENFDDWASTFGEVVSQLELKPAGDGFRMKNRFAKFVNLPELMQMYKEFADIQMADSLHIPGVPEMETGKPIVVIAKPDALQQAYMKELAKRSEAIHNGGVKPYEDNMLKITHEARLLGLDSRTINNEFVPNDDSKVNMLLDNLEKIYKQTEKDRGMQIIFCDIAIHGDKEHFSVYDAIKEGLIERGIPENEICFAGDAKNETAKAKMHEQLRTGEKRFIIASTSKLGTGANVQDRVAAIHHLDIPWRPADLEQQNGRGLRQGNRFKEVGIYHYVTEGTFDAYMLGIITAKAKFISQVMTSKQPARTCEDVDEMVLNYATMSAIASGNPKIRRRIELQNEIAELRIIRAEYDKNKYKMQELSERTLPENIARDTKLLDKAKNDLKSYTDNKPEEFSITLNGTEYTERTEAAKIIDAAILKCSVSGEPQKLGTYAGFEISVEASPMKSGDNLLTYSNSCVLKLHGKLDYFCDLSLKGDSTEKGNIGNIKRMENLAANGIEKRIADIEENIKKANENLAAAQKVLSEPFEHEQKLNEDVEELAKIDEELGTDKEDDFVHVDNSKSDDESEDENVDVSETRDKAFTIKKFDISNLQTETKAQNNTPDTQTPDIKKDSIDNDKPDTNSNIKHNKHR